MRIDIDGPYMMKRLSRKLGLILILVLIIGLSVGLTLGGFIYSLIRPSAHNPVATPSAGAAAPITTTTP